jgi:hypothetical protein
MSDGIPGPYILVLGRISLFPDCRRTIKITKHYNLVHRHSWGGLGTCVPARQLVHSLLGTGLAGSLMAHTPMGLASARESS